MPTVLTAAVFLPGPWPPTGHLSTIDLAIIVVYLIGITLFGLSFRKRNAGSAADKSLKSYFLADNTIPWWAIALSVVSAETSTLTIISIPGVAFAGDFGFLQIVLGYMLGRIVVAALFLPRYFAGEMLTAYQLIDQRFGATLHKVTAGLFLLTRAAAEGVRVFAISIVVGIAIGTGDKLSITLISVLTLLYTFEGGMAAVVWTDVVQMAIYVGGTFVAILTLGHAVPGGWSTIHQVGMAYGKFHWLDFSLDLTKSYTFWAGVLGGTFLTMASHGTDQLMVQRLLASRNLRESRLALLSSGVVIFIQFFLFLLIGVGLFVFYQGGVDSTDMMRWSHTISSDRLFPFFIVHFMPVGIAGLLVAAILAAAMSNLSAALNSLSSTTVVDFYMRFRPEADDRERAIIAKSSTVLWAIVLLSIAIATATVGGKGHVVEIALSIASVAYGCLLGVFLLGTLTKFATEIGASIGMVVGFVVNIALWQFPGKVIYQAVWKLPDGRNGSPMPPITIPHIAFTWYVIIGALVTFAIGALASLIFRKQSTRAVTAIILLPLLLCLPASGSTPKRKHKAAKKQTPAHTIPSAAGFAEISALMNQGIAEHRLPGAVVVVGNSGRIVFHQAFGNRKADNEPALNGQPSPAEPMTEDTIFDMASLTKDLATATAIMQLYDAGKIASFDDPIAKYLPEFLAPPTTPSANTTASGSGSSANTTPTPNGSPTAPSAEGAPIYQPGAQPQVHPAANQRAEGPAYSAAQAARAQVTIRMLLTHYSGETEDISIRDPWGLATPDKLEGIHRALTTPLKSAPGATFRYSDINFILLGALIEKLSGQTEDAFVLEHIYRPLGMTDTRYLPFDKACGPHTTSGAAIVWSPLPANTHILTKCADDTWSTSLLPRIAPTTHDDEGNAETNPHFNQLTRGSVHDPTTRRMGGVAGHAGVFSTAHDVSLFAQALLDRLAGRPSNFPVKQSTLLLMTSPQQPGHTPTQLSEANAADQAAIIAGTKPSAPLLAPAYPAIKDVSLRGFGWDIDTGFSKPRGAIFPIGSFGHTGFTGTTLWMDPGSNSYVVLLSNAGHPRGNPPISNLRGAVATAAACALHLYPERQHGMVCCPGHPFCPMMGAEPTTTSTTTPSPYPPTLTGIDVLEKENFAPLATIAARHDNHLRLGIFTNQAGIDRNRRRTVDILATDLPRAVPSAQVTALFSPEHGLAALVDSENVPSETDAATGLHVTGLYGAKPADRHPTHDMLKDLDAVVIDLQDAGVHFWTYEAAMGYFLEASAKEKNDFHHIVDIVILDRPNLVGGIAVQGPVSDPGIETYTNYTSLPSRHGMTFGELARYFNQFKLDAASNKTDAPLTIVRMQNWTRDQYFASTGLPWINPSPNLRDPVAAILYPGIGLIEFANISVGRGTAEPFHIIGAGAPTTSNLSSRPERSSGERPAVPATAWFKATEVAAALTARHIPGITFTPTSVSIADDANKYPFHGQTIEAIRFTVTDPAALDTPELGMEILTTLHHLYPAQFNFERANRLFDNRATLAGLQRGDDPRTIAAAWQPALDRFKADRAKCLLY